MTSVQIDSILSEAGIRQANSGIEFYESMARGNGYVGGLSKDATESAARERLMLLSDREREVLHLVVSGLTNKATSLKLGISIKTVEKHRSNLMRKLGVLHLPDLMRVWLRAHPEELSHWR